MKKNEPTLVKKTETITSITDAMRVEVRCESSRLYVPPEFKSELGEVADHIARFLPDNMLQNATTKTEAKYLIKITRGDGRDEQNLVLSDTELAQVWETIQKVLVSDPRMGRILG